MSKLIKLIDLNLQHAEIADELQQAFDKVMSKGRFISGNEVKTFETAFATNHGCKHGIGVSSGTDALILALKAMGIGMGDEVIVPSMTFIATAEAVSWLGARPVFVDIDPDTLQITPELVESAINKQHTKAIIPVHLHGYPVCMDNFLKLAQSYQLNIIEDCAQAHGAKESGYSVGSRSMGGCFSFFPAKNLGALGDGGIVITNNDEFADRVRLLSNHGRHQKYVHELIGCNARIDELQAAFLNVKLKYLPKWNEQRRKLAQVYDLALADLPLKRPPLGCSENVPVFHLYVVHCDTKKTRTELIKYLREHNIETGIHYPLPLHLQPAFEHLGYKKGDFPVTEAVADCIVSLPLYPGMTSSQQEYVIEKLQTFFTNQ